MLPIFYFTLGKKFSNICKGVTYSYLYSTTESLCLSALSFLLNLDLKKIVLDLDSGKCS